MKTVLILNGASAISLLTFIGNTTKQLSTQLSIALLLFGFGAVVATLIFLTAYLAQIHYGNAKAESSGSTTEARRAEKYHFACYVLLPISILFFLAGLVATACGLHAAAQL
jgi:hypothetical protein